MAALLVVAIGSAMSPPRALPYEKIHPFYLHRYFCVTTLAGRVRVFVRDSMQIPQRGEACSCAVLITSAARKAHETQSLGRLPDVIDCATAIHFCASWDRPVDVSPRPRPSAYLYFSVRRLRNAAHFSWAFMVFIT